MIRAALLGLILTLTACVEVQQAADTAGRNTAKRAVTEALFVRFPQVPKELTSVFTDCIIDNATGAEIAALAQDAVVGVDDETVTTIKTVLARPQTARCLTTAAPAAAALSY
ncbi:MAG: hypothetical protein WBC93_04600 [Sulfitobacter sp.]